MKRPLTKQLIEEYFDVQPSQIERTWIGGWRVRLSSGASVKITNTRIDFGRYRQLENRRDIDEALFQEEFRTSLDLGEEVWGGICTYGGASQEDCAKVLEYAAKAGIDTGDQGLTPRHFGPAPEFKYSWHGFTVSVPHQGYVKFSY